MEQPSQQEIAIADKQLQAHCKRLLPMDAQGASDLAQQAWERALVNIAKGNYRSEGALAAWLCRIAKNIRVDELRKSKRMPTQDIDDVHEWRLQPKEPMDGAISKDALLAAIHALPEKIQKMITMHYWGELKDREISALTGTNEDTVRTRIFRGRQMLKEQLTPLRHG